MENLEKQEIVFQDPREGQVDQKIAEFEAEGWQLAERIKGTLNLGDTSIPLVRCLFVRQVNKEVNPE